MAVQSQAPQVRAELRRAGYRVTEWVLAILGVIGSAVGLLILVGPDDQYVGLGGEASWAIGEIAPAWGYGMLFGGVLMVIIAAVLALRDRGRRGTGTPESGWGDVLAHSVAFVLVNASLWIQDIALGDGLNYAYWVTIPWAIGLTAHAVAVYTQQHDAAPTNR